LAGLKKVGVRSVQLQYFVINYIKIKTFWLDVRYHNKLQYGNNYNH